MRNITDTPQRPVRELNPQIPEWFAHTIDQLLKKKPDDRIQTAAQLAELLEFQWALLKTTSDDVPSVCEVEHRRQTIRNRWIAAGIGAAFLAVGMVAGSLFFAGGRGSGNGAPAAPVVAPETTLAGNSGAVWAVSLDAGNRTAVMGIDDGSVRLWDVPSEGIKGTIAAHGGTVWVARFTPDGDRIVTAGDDGWVKLWNPATLTVERLFEHPSSVRSVAISKDGKRLYTGDRTGTLRVWAIDGVSPVDGKPAESKPADGAAADAGGGKPVEGAVAAGAGKPVEGAAAKPIVEVKQPGSSVHAVALSPDGATLATAGSDKIVRLWNAATLVPKMPLEGHMGPIYGLSFHPDGRRLASVGWDHTVRIWNTSAGMQIKSWEAHTGDVWSVAYSPDGSKLVTGGTDGAVKIWNAESGELIGLYGGGTSTVHVVAYGDDGRHVLAGSRDGTMRIWKGD
jgi:eukaryotic-like serine/threonine-protein kinase